jgi:hypothetical protein
MRIFSFFSIKIIFGGLDKTTIFFCVNSTVKKENKGNIKAYVFQYNQIKLPPQNICGGLLLRLNFIEHCRE